MKVLITGHTGLLGSTLAKKLISLGHEVYGISRGDRNPIYGVRDYRMDLLDDKAIESIFSNVKPDVVYHLAANASESRGQVVPIDMTQRNIGIFVSVLRASINAKIKRFVYASSVAVYGQVDTPYTETSPTIPKDVYGVNKLACEQILKIMSKVYGFEYTIFRPHNLYGEGQNMADTTRNVVSLFMRKMMEGQKLTLFGEGKMRRAFSYAGDVADVFAQALKSKEYKDITMNVGSTTDITILELLEKLQVITGIAAQIELVPARPQEISMFVADHAVQDKIASYANTDVDAGLKLTWEWVKSQEFQPLLIIKNEIYV